MSVIRLDPNDTVAIARTRFEAGTVVDGITLRHAIPAGHKLAVRAVPKGHVVHKYAQSIGTAACDIAVGDHVHTHNLAFANVDRSYAFGTNLRAPQPATTQDTFIGFDRGDGRIGTRNYIGIITSVNCSATAARMIAQHFTAEVLAPYPNIDGVLMVGLGCEMNQID
jgi:altronate hydrolase